VAVGDGGQHAGARRDERKAAQCKGAVGGAAGNVGGAGVGASEAWYACTSDVATVEVVANHVVDLLIIGTGPTTIPIAPAVRRYLNDLGIRLEIQDTRNASAQFNLLATERGVGQVAAALIPIGWRESR
jgi:NADH dehydrogenase [ubiquinone] 1 alpha subcomplex assembly factor 3